jgi:NADH:ubiquinone oxidoreductase subunit 6 (subunit J)
VFLVRTGVSVEAVLFYSFSAIAVVAGVLLVTQTNPARAALSFALVVLATCAMFLLQAAPFLMAATIIIYAGAIIVTFLFVLMLAQQEGRSDADWRSREPLLACIGGFVLLASLLYVLHQTYWNHNTAAVLDRLDDIIAQATTAAANPSDEEVAATLNGDQFFVDLLAAVEQAPLEPSLAVLARAIKAQEDRWFDHKLQAAAERGRYLRHGVGELKQAVERARATLGDLQPDGSQPLSPFSGSAAPSPPENGQAASRADNTTALGKSLFTDYLLAVELAGTLLLVATIGAIAIAARREAPRP